MRWGIRHQILVPLNLLLLGLVGICAWTAKDSAQLARARIADQVGGVVRTLGEAQFPLNRHVLEQMKGLSGADYCLVEANGQRIATFETRSTDFPPPAALPEAQLGSRIQIGEQTYFCRGVALRAPHPDAGATLYILYPESLLIDAQWQAVRPSLILGVSGGIAAFLLSLVVGQRLVRRMRDLERRTRQIAAGDFHPMPLPPRNDELRDLARSVNEMATRLAQFEDRIGRAERARLLGQLSGGLAHQLRNAVTGARLAIQLHAQSCAAGDAEALEVAERQLTRMAGDLQRFFDVGRNQGNRTTCSLRELAREVIELLRPQCKHAHIDLRWQPPEGEIWTTGDPGQLSHLILNVVSNAVEAAGPGGSVELCLSKTADRAMLDVSDSGPGPDPGIAEQLFEPFVTGKEDGIGLGLAVASQVAAAHGGGISWRHDGGRTCFRIELPLA